jgi:flagellar biosynthesis protein
MSKSKEDKPRTAVALKYDGEGAPHISAKGRGAIAEEILALAREHGVPLHEDRALCELLAQIDLGEEIPRELYVAVAEVIAFAYILTGRFPPGQAPGDGPDD